VPAVKRRARCLSALGEGGGIRTAPWPPCGRSEDDSRLNWGAPGWPPRDQEGLLDRFGAWAGRATGGLLSDSPRTPAAEEDETADRSIIAVAVGSFASGARPADRSGVARRRSCNPRSDVGVDAVERRRGDAAKTWPGPRGGLMQGPIPVTLPHTPDIDVSGKVAALGEGGEGRGFPGRRPDRRVPADEGRRRSRGIRPAPAEILTFAPTNVPLPETAALPLI
jgi:hypothetical protein